jgi:tagaturonate reductase
VPVAYLYGLRLVKESVDDPKIGAFIKATIYDEIIPTLDLPLAELNKFAHDVIERFQNPFVKHELASIALNSISKFKVRVLPSLLEYYNRKKQLPEKLVYSLACLIQFYKGSWHNEILPVNDSADIMDFFKAAWQSGNEKEVAQKVLSNVSFWDQDLTLIPGLTEKVTVHLQQLKTEGVVA